MITTGEKHKNIIVGEMYRIPGTNEQQFIQEFDRTLKIINSEQKEVLLGTDQNIDFLKLNNHKNSSDLFELNLRNNIIPTILKPTRVTHHSATLINNIYISSRQI